MKEKVQRKSPRQLRYLGYAASLTASAVGDRSLIWVYHITGTPGCITALYSVPPPCTQAGSYSLTAEAEGGSLC